MIGNEPAKKKFLDIANWTGRHRNSLFLPSLLSRIWGRAGENDS